MEPSLAVYHSEFVKNSACELQVALLPYARIAAWRVFHRSEALRGGVQAARLPYLDTSKG